MMRRAAVKRHTKETKIDISINLDGSGVYKIDTGIPFLDHMLELFAKHGFFDLEIKAIGDLKVDYHHTVEDLGIALGQAISDSLGNKAGIKRYGFFVLPMDETLITVALDLSGRPCLVYDVSPPVKKINRVLDARLFHEFFQALVVKAGMNLHIIQQKGEDVHHIFEAIFKAFSKALDMASTVDPRLKGTVLSTKGCL
jgi:imidazoleglycerol-phosphate dehydratase